MKDERLYARFDVGMDEHPKIMLLSDAAFRALVEATFYSRRQRTDGFIPAHVARRKWGNKVCTELCSNHMERPSFSQVDGGYIIHDFEKHQTTNADIEAKREAGRLGGLAKAGRRVAPASDSVEQKGSNSLAKTETETDTETSTSNEVEKPPRKRGERLTSEWNPSRELIAQMAAECSDVNLQSEHRVFTDYWIAQPGQKGVKTDWDATWRNWMRRKQSDIGARTTRPTPEQRARQTLSLATDIDMREIGA